MSIYTSDRAHPYVYRLTHRITGEFYFGYREANKTPSTTDLPRYKTSSMKVKELGFDNFEWEIIAEFFSGDDAWDFEQELIKQHFGNSLILNKQHRHGGGKQFKNCSGNRKGKKCPPRTEEYRQKMRDRPSNRKGKKCPPRSDEYRQKMSLMHKGKTYCSPEHYQKLAEISRGRKASDETKKKMSDAHGKTYIIGWLDGSKEQVTNLTQFCKERGLTYHCISGIIRGIQKTHRGVCSVELSSPTSIHDKDHLALSVRVDQNVSLTP